MPQDANQSSEEGEGCIASARYLEEPATSRLLFLRPSSHPGRCSCMAGATVSSHPSGLNIPCALAMDLG